MNRERIERLLRPHRSRADARGGGHALIRLALSASLTVAVPAARGEETGPAPPYGPLPEGMTRLTSFGERADWSRDGSRILFVEKTFGDVYEIVLPRGPRGEIVPPGGPRGEMEPVLRPLTHHYFHEGYTRALYLANGDVLLSGAPEFDARNPWRSRNESAELWVLKPPFTKPPVPLGTKCSEGPAVSRTRMAIAWTIDGGDYPDRMPEGVSQMWIGEIEESEGKPRLVRTSLVLDSRDLAFKCHLETQDFRPPAEKELIFSAYGHQGTEVMGVVIEPRQPGVKPRVTNYSNAPGVYDEPEGIFPVGKHCLVECDRHARKGSGHVDIYKLALDGSGALERLTFFNDRPPYKASNPVVSPDGKTIAFQEARSNEPAGVGHGIILLKLKP